MLQCLAPLRPRRGFGVLSTLQTGAFPGQVVQPLRAPSVPAHSIGRGSSPGLVAAGAATIDAGCSLGMCRRLCGGDAPASGQRARRCCAWYQPCRTWSSPRQSTCVLRVLLVLPTQPRRPKPGPMVEPPSWGLSSGTTLSSSCGRRGSHGIGLQAAQEPSPVSIKGDADCPA